VGTNSAGSRISKWGRGAEGGEVWGGGVPSLLGAVPPPQKKIDLGSQIGEFWCKLGAFCTVHLKLVLHSWERCSARSHCQNNFGNAVPKRSRWKRSLGKGKGKGPVLDMS